MALTGVELCRRADGLNVGRQGRRGRRVSLRSEEVGSKRQSGAGDDVNEVVPARGHGAEGGDAREDPPDPRPRTRLTPRPEGEQDVKADVKPNMKEVAPEAMKHVAGQA